ncbi:prolipoprotein diacylglyceryl transferase [Mycoplasmopsis alligatoris]|uniref:Phosphatidylglycerol--prolipoprotein diacylglyceryl transferase n=1 Tax=Mycoplasmopsis alligatoris A21JP2 TaxID=747682 RepID=D4XVF3_9BACT|nr:prolipoprotein diacylglyceryl transferase [Mycoplasmopsis alligatoris]EFF41659.1 prolipoprotein diacylglyceryl transferase [Mycoplasmopsis alligatoris A21JP2]
MQTPTWIPEFAFKSGDSAILFSIGSYQFHLYSLMIMMGILASILTITFFWTREKYKSEVFLTLILITVPMSIFGSRLGYVIEELIYSPNPFAGSAWYAAWDGGLSIQGGIILAATCDLIYVYFNRHIVDVRKCISYIIPTILIGQFVGRWGNYANHEVYGKIDWTGNSSLIFGKSFAQNMFIIDSFSEQLLGKNQGAFRYPLFLYEGLANLVGYILIVWIFNLFGIFKPGSTSGFYFIWYGLVRLAMEPLRQESFAIYSITALLFIILGTIIFIYYEFWCRVEYKKVWNKYYFEYSYVREEEYLKWVDRTNIKNIIKRKMNERTTQII